MYTTLANIWILLLAGVTTGALGAVLGTGGGVFLIPVLVLGLHVPMHHAIATSIVAVIATSSAVASTNVERGIANMRLGMILEVATAVGALCGGLTAAWISATQLEFLFAAVLVPTAWLMSRGKESDSGPQTVQVADVAISTPDDEIKDSTWDQGLTGQYVDAQSSSTISYRVRRLWAGLLISFLAGNLSGLLGIGGGVFKVPALNLLCGVPIKAAAATSNFMIGVTAAASAFLYYGRGEIRPVLTAVIVVGVLIGSAVGSWLNRFVTGKFLNRLFATLLFGVSLQMMIRALGIWE